MFSQSVGQKKKKKKDKCQLFTFSFSTYLFENRLTASLVKFAKF